MCDNTLDMVVVDGTANGWAINLAANTTYTFRVRPFSNDLGNGNYSPTAFATTTISSTVPTAPTLLNAQPVSNSAINLTWQNNANNENGFFVEQSTNAVNGFLRIATLPAGLQQFARYQPFTPVTETLRGLLTGTPIGTNALAAVARFAFRCARRSPSA
jgi:hypothetical protein